MSNIFKLIVSIIFCELAGLSGSFFTRSSFGWYLELNKPSYRPPDWLFSPVWITLFLLMGISAYLVWKKGTENKEVKYSLIIFLIQLVFNALWSVVFFGGQSIAGGLVVIVILWVLILITIFSFYKISQVAGLLLIPYILWVSFAALLNFTYWKLN
jgi:benzodiazapine receptor